MATIDENQRFAGTEFFPFNDSNPFSGILLNRYVSGSIMVSSSSRGYDTSLIDPFRQGVEMRTNKHVYESIQGKIWAGNINHFVLVRTIGQARSFTEYENTPIFDDLPRKFDPVSYIQSQLFGVPYPFPIIFNNGPQQEEEAIIEPFTIQFRRPSVEGRNPARTVKGSIEDGNNFDSEVGATSRIMQFIDFTPPNEPRYFLDEGQQYIGTFPSASHLTTNYSPIALYHFDGDILDKSGNGKAIQLVIGTQTFEDGPFSGSQALAVNGATGYSSSLDTDFHLTGALTIEAVIRPKNLTSVALPAFGHFMVSIGGTGETLGTNVLGSLVINNENKLGNVGIDLERQFGTEYTNSTNAGIVSIGQWYHLVATRGNGQITSLYLNGQLVGIYAHANFPEKDSTVSNNTQKLWIGTQPTSAGDLTQLAFSGSISNVKIIGRELSQEEVQNEYALLFPTQGGAINEALANSIIVEGFTPVIQREIIPYDETKDERIVNRIQTSDPEYISVLKALDFDLDGDIREDFDKKSATAGNDVYGPDAAIAGTDSIAFIGRTRGN